jgi:hypothetical protein
MTAPAHATSRNIALESELDLYADDLQFETKKARRTDSWPKKAVVYIESNDDLYLTNRSDLEGECGAHNWNR